MCYEFFYKINIKEKEAPYQFFEGISKIRFNQKIEDECDIALADEAYDEYIKSGKRSRLIDELWRELDL